MKTKILFVNAHYYYAISKDLVSDPKLILDKNKIKYKIINVPGVFEIPVIIAKNIKKFDAFIALGCVIKGKTPHFDFISSAVTNAIIDISIIHKKPIGNGILTCLNSKQAFERANPNKKNKGKGGEAARAVLKILEIT